MYKSILRSSKKHIISMMIVIIASAVFVATGYYYWNNKIEKKQSANRGLQSILAKYELAKKNTEIINNYKSKYNQLKAKGMIESENRLSWIKGIELAVNKNLITSVQYKINKQEKYKDAGLSQSYPGIEVYMSNMTIEMDLLHEGDLYAFFNELKNNVNGLFEIKSCDLSIPGKPIGSILDSNSESNMKAKCSVNWYSIKSSRA